ncbi:hypothetical protein, partial [Pseudoalteromonas luteoviolacea]|uniref:hypothetical protein n=1 Tax=Pseudoalteromonas luteoviolacea TaxID=43657 RepID=UPI001E57FEBD
LAGDWSEAQEPPKYLLNTLAAQTKASPNLLFVHVMADISYWQQPLATLKIYFMNLQGMIGYLK